MNAHDLNYLNGKSQRGYNQIKITVHVWVERREWGEWVAGGLTHQGFLLIGVTDEHVWDYYATTISVFNGN